MEPVFLKLVNMSITASYFVLAVMVLRLVLKKAPKYIRCILWGMAALRLICPLSIKSVLSLIPSAEPLPEEFLYAAVPQVNTGIPALNNAINPVVAESLAPMELTSANPTQIWSFICSRIWLIGLILMLLYAAVSYLRLRKRISAFVPVGKNIRLCDHISSPFILGIIHPRIYLPSEITQDTANHVLAHEMAHIARKDHWWKPLGYLLLAVYWFNPMIWAAYILLCRDIELACDERVVKNLDQEEKKAYSSALLRCSVPRRMIAACPLAFGEVDIKSRIKSVLNYRKPAFWVIVVAVAASIAVGVCFLTDPMDEVPQIDDGTYDIDMLIGQNIALSYRPEKGEDQVILTNNNLTVTDGRGNTIFSGGNSAITSTTWSELSAHLAQNEQLQLFVSFISAIEDDVSMDVYEFFKDGKAEYTIYCTQGKPNMIYTGHRLYCLEPQNVIRGKDIVIPYTIEELTAFNDVSVLDLNPSTTAELIALEQYGDILLAGFRDDSELFLVCYEKNAGGSYTRTQILTQEELQPTGTDQVYLAAVNATGRELGVLFCLNENVTAVSWSYSNDAFAILDHCPALIVQDTADRKWAEISAAYELCFGDIPTFPYPEDRPSYITDSVVTVYDGTQRPGYYEQTSNGICRLMEALQAVPQEAITSGLGVEDYYINVLLTCNDGAMGADTQTLYVELRYADGAVDLILHNNTYWPTIEEGDLTYQIRDAKLNAYMETLADHSDMARNAVIYHTSDTTQYTYHYASMNLPHIVGWEYEIVEYTDEYTPFGIRCRPEWVDEGWIFLSFWPDGFEPDNDGLSLTDCTADAGYGTDFILARAENGVDKEKLWVYKQFANLAGDYVILNEGADEWLAENDDIVMYIWANALAQGIITRQEACALAEADVEYPGYKAYNAVFDYKTGVWSVSLSKANSDMLVMLKYDTQGNPVN